jgi:hypothetical protein
MLKERKVLEQNLVNAIRTSRLKAKKKVVGDIKKHLANNYEILDTQSWINDPASTLPELDIRELFLFTEQIFAKTGDLTINPEEYFTEAQIKDARHYSGVLKQKENELNFPLTFPNATIVGTGAFMVTMDIQTIDKLIGNGLLDYNYDLQREATYRRSKSGISKEPTLVMSNVKEISQHLLEGTLVPTVLVFNAQTRSSDTGTELVYNSNTLELTVQSGTDLFIVDGWHRCRGSQNALQINPELHFNFGVLITNYSTKKSQQYQAQLARATPISKVRIQELEANRLSDTVVQQLKEESDLKGRISQTNRIHSLNKEVVTYNVLSNTIDEQFKMETRSDAADVGDYLTEFFNFLIGEYPDEFLNHIEETKKESLINDNNFFVGYLVLARRMYEKGIKARDVRKYVKEINFSRNNKEWQQINILDEKGNITETTKVRKIIKEYFEGISL